MITNGTNCTIFYGIMLMGDLFPTRSHARDLWVILMWTIWVTNGVRIESYRSNADHTYVNTAPDDVPYPIEPTWYVLGRMTTAFRIGTREPDVKTTW